MGGSRHRGGKTGGIIWEPPPRKPLSPHLQRRGRELALLWEVCDWLCLWWTRDEDDSDDDEAFMWRALTRWYCSLDLPTTQAALIEGPPILSRRSPQLR